MSLVNVVCFLGLFLFSSDLVHGRTRLSYPGWQPANFTFSLTNFSTTGGQEKFTKIASVSGSSMPLKLGYRFEDETDSARLLVRLINALPPKTFQTGTICGNLRLVNNKKSVATHAVPFVSVASFFDKEIETFTLLSRSVLLNECNGYVTKDKDILELQFKFNNWEAWS